jgi:AbiV family abortive infection protein
MDKIQQNNFGEGISLSIANAERLLSDVKLLFENRKYASARVFAMLSWEETAKASFILEHRDQKQPIDQSEWKRKFVHHASKLDGFQNIMGFVGEPIFENERREADLIEYFEDYSVRLKSAREGLTYVNYDFDNNRWVSPKSVFVFYLGKKEDCSEVITKAEACLAWIKEQL